MKTMNWTHKTKKLKQVSYKYTKNKMRRIDLGLMN